MFKTNLSLLKDARNKEEQRQENEQQESGKKLQNEDESNVSVKDVQKHTLSRLIKDYYKLALIFGSVGVEPTKSE